MKSPEGYPELLVPEALVRQLVDLFNKVNNLDDHPMGDEHVLVSRDKFGEIDYLIGEIIEDWARVLSSIAENL